jgi:hypothetical protein
MPRILSLVALPLLAAASLTAAGSVESGSFLRTEHYALIVGNARDAWCEEGDAASVLAEPADLRGAHFSFSLECLFKAPKVPEDLSASIPELEHLPPAQDGAEFLFAQVSLPADENAEYTYDPSALTSWIEIGWERINLSTTPAVQQFYVVSAPIDEPAVLWTEDSGRAQGIDLRTGEQVEPVSAYYNGLALRSFDFGGFDTEEVDLRNGRYSGWIRCKTEQAEATRAVWMEDRGWAEEGTVFLEVRTNWCAKSENFTWDLDRTKAFTIDGEGPVSWTATESEAGEGWNRLRLLFVIPADSNEATVDFSPVGTIEIRENGVEMYATKLPNFAWEMAF